MKATIRGGLGWVIVVASLLGGCGPECEGQLVDERPDPLVCGVRVARVDLETGCVVEAQYVLIEPSLLEVTGCVVRAETGEAYQTTGDWTATGWDRCDAETREIVVSAELCE